MLTASGLTFTYNHQPLLSGISFTLQPGELMAIIGPNGVGKSTLLRILGGSLSPQAGQVLIDGQNMHKLPAAQRARRLAVVSQSTSIPAAFTVWEVVLLGRTPYLDWFGNTSATDEAIAMQALETAGIARYKDRYVHQLSGGERQLLLLAKALAQQVSLLYLDEPTANLDLKRQVETLAHVHHQVEHEGAASLVVMHDLNLVAQFADRVLLLARGGENHLGTPDDVLTETLLSESYGLPVRVFPANGSTPFFVQPAAR